MRFNSFLSLGLAAIVALTSLSLASLGAPTVGIDSAPVAAIGA
jgi:hypothetical protein